MSNFTFFHNVFYAICILKFFTSHISASLNFEWSQKWSIREWVQVFWMKLDPGPVNVSGQLDVHLGLNVAQTVTYKSLLHGKNRKVN